MTQINDIRKAFFEEGQNISQIARTYRVDRKTVRRYINKTDWNQPVAVTTAGVFPKLTPYKEKIDHWLLDDKSISGNSGILPNGSKPREEWRTICCSYRTVAGYVAIKKKNSIRGYLHDTMNTYPEAQVDFGHADFYENGTLYNGAYLNVSPHSNAGYTQLFKGKIRCLLEGLKQF